MFILNIHFKQSTKRVLEPINTGYWLGVYWLLLLYERNNDYMSNCLKLKKTTAREDRWMDSSSRPLGKKTVFCKYYNNVTPPMIKAFLIFTFGYLMT